MIPAIKLIEYHSGGYLELIQGFGEGFEEGGKPLLEHLNIDPDYYEALLSMGVPDTLIKSFLHGFTYACWLHKVGILDSGVIDG